MDLGSFGVGSKASMKRKQSNSLLEAFSKGSSSSSSSRVSAIPIPAPAPATVPESTPSPPLPPLPPSEDTHSYSTDSPWPDSASAYSYSHSPSAGRSVSAGSTAFASQGKATASASGTRVEDVQGVIKDRLFAWSYMMQWYQGDTHWFNTVKIPRSTVESHLGPKIDQRARNFFLLGASLSPLFDIAILADYLKALLKLLEEWEALNEGGSAGKGVKGLFRGQKGKKGEHGDSDSSVVSINLPFMPDFFQVHAATCSIIRDIYKKLLRMILPSSPNAYAPPPASSLDAHTQPQSLFHPSTFIHSAILGGGGGGGGPSSPDPNAGASASTLTPSISQHLVFPSRPGPAGLSPDLQAQAQAQYSTPSTASASAHPERIGEDTPRSTVIQQDAFQAFVAGVLPPDHSLVGDGQKLTPQLMDLFLKVDQRIKKHFSLLVREGDTLARRTLDEELSALMSSLSSAQPMSFDYQAALSGSGNGWHLPSPSPTTSTTTRTGAGAGTDARGMRRWEWGSLEEEWEGEGEDGSQEEVVRG